ncbi:MAG: transposase [Candidatus Saccharimonadales bacterium]
MPGKNIIKEYAADHYYHIYSRGVNKQPVFLDHEDYEVFLGLLKRYLGHEKPTDTSRHAYPNYSDEITLLAYCLMKNHIHLLVYQKLELGMPKLMRSVMTSYSMYFNKRYKRVGPVFQSRYRASMIEHDGYLEHISRYIHLNPKEWKSYEYSSLPYYLGTRSTSWVTPQKIMELFNNEPRSYLRFMNDYQAHKQMLDEIKWELAGR